MIDFLSSPAFIILAAMFAAYGLLFLLPKFEPVGASTFQHVMYWVRANLLNSPLNVVITSASILLLVTTIPPILDWAIFNADFTGADRTECTSGGACWAVIHARYDQLLFGFYEKGERWRPVLAFFLLFVALAPILYKSLPMRKGLLKFAMIYPLLAYWLIMGDGLLLPDVASSSFGGFTLTLILGVGGIALSLPVGIALALGRRSKMPLIRVFCVTFIEFIRGVPLIALLYVASFLLPLFFAQGFTPDVLARVLFMVVIFASAYMAEVIRGGLQALPKGQTEAYQTLGLSYWQGMFYIILPQALKICIPGIVNTFIGLFKDTTLVLIVGLLDLLGIGRGITQHPNWLLLDKEIYVAIALLFFVCCFSMSRYSLWLERQLDTGHKN